MRREYIRCAPRWRHGAERRYDTVFVNKDNDRPSLLGIDIARVFLLFSFTYREILHCCAAVHWFARIDDEPDDQTGMWVVQPAYHRIGRRKVPLFSVISLDTIIRASHLIGVSINQEVTERQTASMSLDTFTRFFVNKYIDHHAFDLLHIPSPPLDHTPSNSDVPMSE